MRRKTISFDLSIKMLKRYYPGKDHHQAYKDIQKYMKINGFKHKQFSGYRSKSSMSTSEATLILDQLIQKNPWILPCIKDLDITTETTFNLKDLYERNAPAFEKYQQEYLNKKKEQHKTKGYKRRPMKEVMAEAQREADEYNTRLGIRPISKDDLEL